MADAIYPKFKEFALGLSLGTVTPIAGPVVRAWLIDGADYAYDATDEFLSDVAAGARVASSSALGSKTYTDGVFDAADTTFSAASGDTSEHIILTVEPGSGANAGNTRLIAFLDGAGITGSPVIPNGGDINVAWDNGGNKIFKL